MKTGALTYACLICLDTGWVCEDHKDTPWFAGDGCCGAAGAPCKCNTATPPWGYEPPLKEKTP